MNTNPTADFDRLWQAALDYIEANAPCVRLSPAGHDFLLQISKRGSVNTERVIVDADGQITERLGRMQTASREYTEVLWRRRSDLGPSDTWSYARTQAVFAEERGGAGGHHYAALCTVTRLMEELATAELPVPPTATTPPATDDTSPPPAPAPVAQPEPTPEPKPIGLPRSPPLPSAPSASPTQPIEPHRTAPAPLRPTSPIRPVVLVTGTSPHDLAAAASTFVFSDDLSTTLADALEQLAAPASPPALWIEGAPGAGCSTLALLLAASVEGATLPEGGVVEALWFSALPPAAHDRLARATAQLRDPDPLLVRLDARASVRGGEELHEALMRAVGQALGDCRVSEDVARAERKLEAAGLGPILEEACQRVHGTAWDALRQTPLADELFSELMHDLFAPRYPTPTAWFESRAGEQRAHRDAPTDAADTIAALMARRAPARRLWLLLDHADHRLVGAGATRLAALLGALDRALPHGVRALLTADVQTGCPEPLRPVVAQRLRLNPDLPAVVAARLGAAADGPRLARTLALLAAAAQTRGEAFGLRDALLTVKRLNTGDPEADPFDLDTLWPMLVTALPEAVQATARDALDHAAVRDLPAAGCLVRALALQEGLPDGTPPIEALLPPGAMPDATRTLRDAGLLGWQHGLRLRRSGPLPTVLRDLAHALGLDERAVQRYHLASATHPLVILVGGPEATALAWRLAEALELEHHLAMVQPSWADERDVFRKYPTDEYSSESDVASFLNMVANRHTPYSNHDPSVPRHHLIFDGIHRAARLTWLDLLAAGVRRTASHPVPFRLQDRSITLPDCLAITATADDLASIPPSLRAEAHIIDLRSPEPPAATPLWSQPRLPLLHALHRVLPLSGFDLDALDAYIVAATALGLPADGALDDALMQRVVSRLAPGPAHIADLHGLTAQLGDLPRTRRAVEALTQRLLGRYSAP